MILLIISIIVISIYAMVILTFILGNLKKESKVLKESRRDIMVSVIVPFRNEDKNLKNLCSALKNQSYARELIEFIFINDHSEDDGVNVIEESFLDGNFNYRIICLTVEFGKKSSIIRGVNEAEGGLILTTDADCVMYPNWVRSMVDFHLSTNSKFILAPVKMNRGKGWFKAIQEIEFASLMACTSGSSALGKPILSNGANLCFTKELFLELEPYKGNLKIASGDDIFFLHAVKKSNYSSTIKFNNQPEAVVSTKVSRTIFKFLNQRIRWAKKAKHYYDRDSVAFGLTVSGINLLIIVQLILALYDFRYLNLVYASWAIKFIFDTALIYSANSYLRLNQVYFKALILSLLYPFYFICVALLSLTLNPKWKGRNVSV